MAKTVQEEFIYKKVYEFSYATFSIASSAKNRETGALLGGKAISLLDSVLAADYEKTKDLVYAIISLAGLLVDSGNLHPVNKEVLIKEAEKIDLAIEALPKKKDMLPDLNLNKIFSKTTLPINSHTKRGFAVETKNEDHPRYGVGVKKQNTNQSAIADKNFAIADEIADKTSNRQSAIMKKLQQSENTPDGQLGCRLNELQAIFPEISERTLRYDLESLISRGLVERLGSRRNSFYRAKSNGDSAVIELPAPSAIRQ